MTSLDEILRALDSLPEPKRAEVLSSAESLAGGRVWLPNPGPQSDALFSEADELFFGGQAGGGKALEVSTPVLTPTGWKAIGGLKVGDSVCATDGTVQEVIGVYPQGTRPLYRVVMRDGASVLADGDHNWLAWRTHGATKKANAKLSGSASARKWTTRQMHEEMEKGPRGGGRCRGFAIPLTQPVKFNVAGQLKGRGNFIGREIDPYLLGLILGDGSIEASRVQISSADVEIAEYVRALYGADVAVDVRAVTPAVSIRFRGASNKALLAALSRLGLARARSTNKFIPRQYLFAPTEARFELLRGLMDADGWAEAKRGVFFTSASERLASDVAHLAGSLGMVASTTIKSPTYSYLGEKKHGLPAYAVRIKAPEPVECFKLSRKRAVAATIAHQSLSRVIESITFERDGEAVCIAVSNANSLYIADGFIVTHNSDLAIGLAITEHHRSLLLRRTNKEALGLVERMAEVIGNRDGWSGQQGIWRLGDRTVDIGGCQLEDDKQKYKGTPHDLIAFDELSDFTETQYTFISGWNRSTKTGQRCRVVATGNPPTSPEGLWVLKRWAAWLDPTHPKPAKPGELRWYTTGADGREIEVDGPGPHEIAGEMVRARSRTFIPSKLSDNPDLSETNYAAMLAALPEDLRAAYRDGRFDLGIKDRAFQVIPTAWVKAAIARWTPHPPPGVPLCAMGIDASGGGTDPMVIAKRYDGWYAPFTVVEGKDIPIDRAGAHCAGIVVSHRRDNARVIVDLGGGYGSSMYEQLKANSVEVEGYKGAAAAMGRTLCNKFKFKNMRSSAIWRFREALDPGQSGGSQIMLPNDPELVADLTAPTYKPDAAVIEVENKVDVCKRLGRSTNKGDAAIMAWTAGVKNGNVPGGFKSFNHPPQVVRGYAGMKRR